MTLARRDKGLIAGAAILALGCVGAGIWQIGRLRERRARNAAVAARLARPPLALNDSVLALPPDSAAHRRVVASGIYDFAHERVWPGRSFDGTPGVGLVTPLRLADGSAVFVDRGWVPSPDAYHVNQPAYRESDTARVEGLAVLPPRGRGDVDPTRLADSVPYRLYRFVVQLETPSPLKGRGLPRRWPPPALGNGPHLSYVVQWFSFAIIIVVGTVALVRRRNA